MWLSSDWTYTIRFENHVTRCVCFISKSWFIQHEFYLLFKQKSEFWPKCRNSGSKFFCQHETSHTTCYTYKLFKIIDFPWLEWPPRMKIATVLNFMTSDWLRKVNAFGQLVSAATLYPKFHAGTRNHLSNFWPPLRSGYCYLNKGECNLNQSKHGSFVERLAENNSWNNADRHKIHEIFMTNCFVFVITLVCKSSIQSGNGSN